VADLATMPELVVRMGELAISTTTGNVLVCIGLGSCIGLALVARHGQACGVAHVMLPESGGRPAKAGKFADLAVPALIDGMARVGVGPHSLDAVLAGGAQMFAGSTGIEIGARNEAAVRAGLAAAGIPVHAAATAGNNGRTMRVEVGAGSVTVREAGATEVTLRPPSTPAPGAKPLRGETPWA
jgi:chemotaxis protein CheD